MFTRWAFTYPGGAIIRGFINTTTYSSSQNDLIRSTIEAHIIGDGAGTAAQVVGPLENIRVDHFNAGGLKLTGIYLPGLRQLHFTGSFRNGSRSGVFEHVKLILKCSLEIGQSFTR